MDKMGDEVVPKWTGVECLLDEMLPGTTTVITGDDTNGYRVRWTQGTDLEPLGGIKGSENAQINYLTLEGDWLDIPAFG